MSVKSQHPLVHTDIASVPL